MGIRLLSVIAIILGSLCAAVAFVAYRNARAAAAMPFAVGPFDERYFWWPLFASLTLWTLACVGFLKQRKRPPRLSGGFARETPGTRR